MRRRRRTHRPIRTYAGNPLSTGQEVAIALAGVAIVGAIGYYLYQNSQQGQTASGGAGGSLSGGSQSTVLGSGGSSSPLGPAAGSTGVDSTAYAPGYSAANPPPAGTYVGEV